MEWFLLTTISVAILTKFILAVTITLYLFSIQEKSRATWWLIALFISFSAYTFCQLVLVSVVVPWQPYFIPLQHVLSKFIWISGIQFAYEFLGNPYERESKIVLVFTGIATAGIAGYTGYRFVVAGPEDLPYLLWVLALLFTIWNFVVFLRKSRHFSMSTGAGQVRYPKPTRLGSKEGVRYLAARLAATAGMLLKPRGNKARAHAGYALLMIVQILLIDLMSMLTRAGIMIPKINNYVATISHILFLSGFAIFYFNHSFRLVTLHVKLVGISLVTMLAVLGLISFEIYSEAELVRDQKGLLSPERESIRFFPNEDGGYQVATLPFRFDPDVGGTLRLDDDGNARVALGFPFSFYGTQWDEVHVNKDGVVTFGGAYPRYDVDPGFLPIEKNPEFYNALPKIALLLMQLEPSQGGGIFHKLEPDKATFTWKDVPQRYTANLNTMQLVLHSNGIIVLAYDQLAAQAGYYHSYGVRGLHPGGANPETVRIQFSNDLPYELEAGTSLFEDYGIRFRQFVHSKVSKLAYMMLGATLFILIAFPIVFRANVMKPLKTLLEGVKHVNTGNFEVEVPIQTYDEIGALTDHFNRMTDSLKQADQALKAYAEDLEQRVAARTRDLKTKKDELEKALRNLQTMQAQLIQVEKMASLGQLTAGIAHEIKNPLNFVNNFAQVSAELTQELAACIATHQHHLDTGDLGEIEGLLEDLRLNSEKINEQGKRADSIVNSMMQHTRGTSGHRESTDVNVLLDEYVNLAYHGMRARQVAFNTTIERDYDEAVGKILLVPQEIGRVFINLLNNAFYAVNEKAKIQDGSFKPRVSVSTRRLDDAVEIRVRDNGSGIPEKIRAKVFEPFFTTKPSGSGTGLGLSLSYDIVVQGHGGRLRVESEPGVFTEFIISLPA